MADEPSLPSSKNHIPFSIRNESLMTTRITTYFNECKVNIGTGFIYKFGQTTALVSNWHVFSNRNAIKPTIINGSSGLVPNKIKFHIIEIKARNHPDLPATQTLLFREVEIDLYNENICNWWRARDYETQSGEKRIVDIGVLFLDDYLSSMNISQNDVYGFSAIMLAVLDGDGVAIEAQSIFPRVADDVFILGYPGGVSAQGCIPVWKRGTIASEPLITIGDGMPVYYVDSLTKSGMSGSPVVTNSNILTDRFGHTSDLGPQTKDTTLIGIYAGREGATDDEASLSLGRVWRKDLLDGIFFNRIPGDDGFEVTT